MENLGGKVLIRGWPPSSPSDCTQAVGVSSFRSEGGRAYRPFSSLAEMLITTLAAELKHPGLERNGGANTKQLWPRLHRRWYRVWGGVAGSERAEPNDRVKQAGVKQQQKHWLTSDWGADMMLRDGAPPNSRTSVGLKWSWGVEIVKERWLWPSSVARSDVCAEKKHVY